MSSAIIADENVEAVKWEDSAKALPVSGPKDLLTQFYYRPDDIIKQKTAATRWAGFTSSTEYREVWTWLGCEEDLTAEPGTCVREGPYGLCEPGGQSRISGLRGGTVLPT